MMSQSTQYKYLVKLYKYARNEGYEERMILAPFYPPTSQPPVIYWKGGGDGETDSKGV
jgi:hypothetical protein